MYWPRLAAIFVQYRYFNSLFIVACLCVCIGRYSEITNNELSSQIVLDESRADNFIMPVCVKTSQIRPKLRYSRSFEVFEQHTISSRTIQGQRIEQKCK